MPSALPMHENHTSGVEGILDEPRTGGKMLKEILIIDIINLDDFVGETFEQISIQRQSQDRKYMRNATFLQRLLASQCEEPGVRG